MRFKLESTDFKPIFESVVRLIASLGIGIEHQINFKQPPHNRYFVFVVFSCC